METGKVVLGTLAGIAIGAVVGVLLAPDKGSETRRKLSQKGSEYKDGLKEKYDGLKDKYNNLVDGVTNKLESLSSTADNLAQTGKNAMSETKSTASTATR
jgi:gas vesicle protein